MATNKIKFKMSIEKIEFEFEGDYEHGRSIQQGITHTLGGLSNVQNRAMGLDDANGRKLIENKVIEPAPAPAPVRRRKKRRSSAGGGEAATDAETTGDGQEDGALPFGNGGDESAPRQARSSTGTSPTGLLVDLRKSGFFNEGKTSGEVLDELHRKAYSNIRSNHLTAPMQRLVQKDVLRRDHDSQKSQWVYTNGTHDELA